MFWSEGTEIAAGFVEVDGWLWSCYFWEQQMTVNKESWHKNVEKVKQKM